MKIDKHDVLGSLFGVVEQLRFERSVLVSGGAAPACPGQRARGNGLAVYTTEYLRAGANQRAHRRLHVEHVRRWIDDPQGAIDIERLHLACHAESLAGYELKNISGTDVLLPLENRVVELLRGHVARMRPTCGCARVNLT